MTIKRPSSDHLPALLQAIALERDQQAYQKIFYHFYADLVRYSHSILEDLKSAEDVVSEVLLRLWLLEKKALAIQNLSFYLYRSVKNSSLNELKNLKRTQSLPLDFEVLDSQSPERLLISKEKIASIEEAIQMLPPKCKTVFSLLREQQLSYVEVAELLDISVNTVSRHLQLALQKLTDFLAKE